jgi:hypothetical protein
MTHKGAYLCDPIRWRSWCEKLQNIDKALERLKKAADSNFTSSRGSQELEMSNRLISQLKVCGV